MSTRKNPFVYEQARLMSDEVVAQYYIDDHSHGRLLRSRRNIFLIGERGSGKTMELLYNTLPIQKLVMEGDNSNLDLGYIGALVPANTPLIHRQEHDLLDRFRASVVSEHFFALAIVFHLSEALGFVADSLTVEEEAALRTELAFYFDSPLPHQTDIFDAVCQMAQHESIEAQKALNVPAVEGMYTHALSFSSLAVPFMRAVKKAAAFRESHFMLMIDDAHMLNPYQVRSLNSWIAYRDRSLFSLKVATAKVGLPARKTGTGGDILEGHDFLTIDMERPFHNEGSDFGKFAARVVRRRLESVGVSKSPEEFFSVHPRLASGLRAAAESIRSRAMKEMPNAGNKRIGDYVYRQTWAEFIRKRSPQANRPLYSGFSTLTFISTGVIRNLLEPCFWMWEAIMKDASVGDGRIKGIPPSIQAKVILDRSEVAWARLRTLDMTIDGCSHRDAKRVRRLFEELSVYFQRRLFHHRSEPSATSFSLSGRDSGVMNQLSPLLSIAQRAQLLYIREGPAKTMGRRELYYVPNRILWPSRGMDPHGQHARASIMAKDVLAASEGRAIPFHVQTSSHQHNLFSTEEVTDARE
ncbi:MAG: hypothetical protein OXN89_22940 [Bryobacterales bacterium]|nr:hypothetical protein [Bryobacterales bacterium]